MSTKEEIEEAVHLLGAIKDAVFQGKTITLWGRRYDPSKATAELEAEITELRDHLKAHGCKFFRERI